MEKGREGLSVEYLQALVDKARAYLPDWLFQELHRAAVPAAGGKARARVEEPTPLEKLALVEMRPAILARVPDDELRLAWLRLHQWYGAARRRGEPVEDLVNAAIWVMEEFERRGFSYDEDDELVQAARELRKGEGLESALRRLPAEVLLIKDFVSVVGSAARGDPEPGDIDVLIRANRDESGEYFLLQADGVWLPIRNALDPEKSGILHWLDSPQGSHGDYYPCYSLVLRRERPERVVVKAEGLDPEHPPAPEKPAMTGTVEYFSTEELWPWVEEKLKSGAQLIGEVKFDGFRCMAAKTSGGEVHLWSEGGRDLVSDGTKPLVEALLSLPARSFLIDGELCGARAGAIIPRTMLAAMLRGEGGISPSYWTFDLLYLDGKDLSSHPLSDRREALEALLKGLDVRHALYLHLSEAKPIRSKQDLRRVGMWAAATQGSEGLVVKDASKPYHPGASDDWAKWKTVVELRVRVMDRRHLASGKWSYSCAVPASVGSEGRYVNARDIGGTVYVELGSTFPTDYQAKEGDVIPVRVEEVLLLQRRGRVELAWGKPTVAGPAEDRPAYTSDQVIDLARRGHALKSELEKSLVPQWVPPGARLAYVGLRPGAVDAARGAPLTGPVGETFRRLYLDPLRLKRSEVAILSLVPIAMDRDPDQELVEEWRPALFRALAECGAPVVALGRRAREELGNLALEYLPHPAAVRYLGDSGEVGRKAARIRKALRDEVDTRSEAAAKWWAEHWWKAFPPSGRGRFVYHHHWRGLSEEESKMDEEELLRTDHSLHGDLRFEGDDELWGVTVFLGSTADNRHGDRLANLSPKDALQVAFKLGQPDEWLDVGKGGPMVVAPGSVGATGRSYAKFFAVDRGTYEVGVWREHCLEVFLHGKMVVGRYLLQYAPVGEGGKRTWLISKPADQTPYAESRSMEEVRSELASKGQRYLVWGGPGRKPELIRIEKGAAGGRILKADGPKQLVYGVVIEPGSVDAHGDVFGREVVEEAAHKYLARYRVVGLEHKDRTDAVPVESYIAPCDLEIGGQPVKEGSWVMAVHVRDPEVWEAIEKGEITGFSPGGFGVRAPLVREEEEQ